MKPWLVPLFLETLWLGTRWIRNLWLGTIWLGNLMVWCLMAWWNYMVIFLRMVSSSIMFYCFFKVGPVRR